MMAKGSQDVVYGSEFDPHSADAAQIMAFARRLCGRPLRLMLPPTRLLRERSVRDKGAVGQLVERYFNIEQNSDSAPDFSGAGIELKVVPLKSTNRGVRAKERTVISMIDFAKLAEESWETASVRKKLERILFVFYDYVRDQEALDARIKDVVLWSPGEDIRPQLEQDWSVVQRKARLGFAHEVSEGDGRILGAATKGASGSNRVAQYLDKGPPARPRAWALKPSLTSHLFETIIRGADEVSLAQALPLTPGQQFEFAVLQRLESLRGKTIAKLAGRLDVPISRAKSGIALLVRRALGVQNDRARIREFEQFGIEIKTAPVSPAGKPFESMSFPRFDHMEIGEDEWFDSDLRARLERLLIVPVIRDSRDQDKAEHRIGRAFFWSPSADELDAIQIEWELFRDAIKAGRADRLPSARETKFIHVRPKGRDGRDTEPAPGGHVVVKKCFWLNASYVEQIIASTGGPS
jgi:DNA mismatch repair endonuclease MutH